MTRGLVDGRPIPVFHLPVECVVTIAPSGDGGLLVATPAEVVASTGDRWTRLGERLPTVAALARIENRIWAGNSTGLFVLDTDHASWVPSLSVSSVTSIAYAAETLVVGTAADGVFRSVDGGATWFSSSAGLHDLRIVALVTSGSVLLAATSSALYRTTNGGRSWREIASWPPPEEATALAVWGEAVMVGSSAGLMSIDSGGGVRRVGIAEAVSALVVDGADLLAFRGSDVSRLGSLDGPVESLPCVGDVVDVALRTERGIVVSARNASIQALGPDGWTPWGPPLPGSALGSLDQDVDGLVWRSEAFSFLSTDGGRTWTPADPVPPSVTTPGGVTAELRDGEVCIVQADRVESPANQPRPIRALRSWNDDLVALLQRDRDGEHWTAVLRSAPPYDRWSPILSSTGSAPVVLLCHEADLVIVIGDEVLRAAPDGSAPAPVGRLADRTSVALALASHRRGIAAATTAGVEFSRDGAEWRLLEGPTQPVVGVVSDGEALVAVDLDGAVWRLMPEDEGEPAWI